MILAGAVVPLLGSAPAEASIGDCPADQVCFFQDINFDGLKVIPSVNGGGGWASFDERSFNDKASSAVNNKNYDWCLYEHNDFGGRYVLVPRHSAISDLRANDFNDMASSAKQCNFNFERPGRNGPGVG